MASTPRPSAAPWRRVAAVEVQLDESQQRVEGDCSGAKWRAQTTIRIGCHRWRVTLRPSWVRERRRAPRAQRRSLSESDVRGRKREQQLPAHAAALGGGPTPRRRDAYLEPLDGETLTQSLSPTSCTLTKRATRVRAKCLHLPHWATTHVPVTPVTPVTCAFLIRGGPRRPAGGAGRFRSPTHHPLSEQPHITHILHHIPRIMCACMQLAVAYWATVGTD